MSIHPGHKGWGCNDPSSAVSDYQVMVMIMMTIMMTMMMAIMMAMMMVMMTVD